MPYIDKNDKPTFLDRSKPAMPQHDPLTLKNAPSKSDSFAAMKEKGMSRPPVLDKQKDETEHTAVLIRKLKAVATKQKLAVDLKANPSSEKIKAAIKEMEEEIGKYGVDFDPTEKHSFESPASQYKRYWEEKHEVQKLAEGGITSAESKQIAERKIKRSFLDRFLGLNKK